MAPGEPPPRAAALGLGTDEARSWRPFHGRSPAGRMLRGLRQEPVPGGIGALWIREIDGLACQILLPGFAPFPEAAPALIEGTVLTGPLLFLGVPVGVLVAFDILEIPGGDFELYRRGSLSWLAEGVRQGLTAACQEARRSVILADGGEGTLKVMASLRDGAMESWPSITAMAERRGLICAPILDHRERADPESLLLLGESWRERIRGRGDLSGLIAHLPKTKGQPYWRFPCDGDEMASERVGWGPKDPS